MILLGTGESRESSFYLPLARIRVYTDIPTSFLPLFLFVSLSLSLYFVQRKFVVVFDRCHVSRIVPPRRRARGNLSPDNKLIRDL